jgi:hypothetical protein
VWGVGLVFKERSWVVQQYCGLRLCCTRVLDRKRTPLRTCSD